MRRALCPLAVAGIALLGACGDGGEASGPDSPRATATATEIGPDTSVVDTDANGQSAGDLGSGSTGVASSGSIDGGSTDDSAVPFGEEERDGDGVEFVTTSSTTTTSTTTTLPPTTTTSTTTSTTTTSTSTSTSTTTTSTTTTTVPPPTMIRCSFAADALFEPGEAVLTDEALAGFDELATTLSGIADVRSVRVEGHTDHRGSDDENLTLSQARADAAAAALLDAGIDESLITAIGLGE